MPNLPTRIANAWNAFKRPFTEFVPSIGSSYGAYPLGRHYNVTNEQTFVSGLYNRVAMDVSAVDIRHIRMEPDSRQYITDVPDDLNTCLTLSANVDQTGRGLIQDLVLTMFDEGVAALVPIDTSVDPLLTDSYDIYTMRVGTITEWFPQDVRLNVWDDRTGQFREIIRPKNKIAIVQNPLYSVMNEPNSNLQRLIRKLRLLDVIDEQTSSGKLDVIIQFPYTIKSEARKKQAEQRRKLLEDQLTGSRYGIAYADGSERITQLNRPVENNLLNQIQYLTPQVYGQLGISEAIMNGTASEQEMLNYYTRTLDPILTAICDAMTRTFLTKTARTQGHAIKFFRDPFRLVPVSQLAEIAQKLTAAEVLSSNEIRSAIFYPKSTEPNADSLKNPNINVTEDSGEPMPDTTEEPTDEPQSEGVIQDEV